MDDQVDLCLGVVWAGLGHDGFAFDVATMLFAPLGKFANDGVVFAHYPPARCARSRVLTLDVEGSAANGAVLAAVLARAYLARYVEVQSRAERDLEAGVGEKVRRG